MSLISFNQFSIRRSMSTYVIYGNKIAELKIGQETDDQLAIIIQALNERETAQSIQLLDSVDTQYKKISNRLVIKDGVLSKFRNKTDNKIVIVAPVGFRNSIME
jgi:hypothetical protein